MNKMFENEIMIHDSDIEAVLYDICDKYNYDLFDINQNIWNGVLLKLNKAIFYGKKDIYFQDSKTNYKPSYDILKVNYYCDMYIDLCLTYNKIPNIMGFSKFTGIKRDTIYRWNTSNNNIYNNNNDMCVSNIDNELNVKPGDIIKKLTSEHEEALASKMADNRGNATGQLAILNTYFKWNMPGVTREATEKQALNIQQLPQFEQKALDIVSEQQ